MKAALIALVLLTGSSAAVPAQALAESVVGNYGTCHETAEQLTALQDWIKAQQGIKP
jgi:hypothetical protein